MKKEEKISKGIQFWETKWFWVLSSRVFGKQSITFLVWRKKMMNQHPRPLKHRRRPWNRRRSRRKFSRQSKGHSILQQIHHADPILERIAGKAMATRSGFVKLIWSYIKRNQLQKPGQGRTIIPNKEFAEFMGSEGQEINGFTMARYIEQHLLISCRVVADKSLWNSL